MTESHDASTAEEPSAPRHLALAAVAIVVLGVALRLALFATGRSPMDGDEAIMGIMGYDLRSLNRVPLYFYGQSYLGSLEIPVLSLVQFLGATKDWSFSVWPIRVTAGIYLALLGLVHYRLTRRCFGEGVALCGLLFLMIGPYVWADYSSRLRHVVVMMTLGELLFLLVLDLLDEWNSDRRERGRRTFLLGLLAGLAWWHYQLVAIFLIAILVLMAATSDYLGDFLRAPLARRGVAGSGTTRVRPAYALRLLLLIMPLGAFAAMTLGKGWSYWPHYEWILLGLGLIAVPAFILPWRAYRRERAEFIVRADPAISPWEPLHHFAPALVILGFLLGSVPSFIYMSTLELEFWVHPTAFDPLATFERLRSTLWTEVGPMLDIVRLDSYDAELGDYRSPTTLRTYLYLLVFGIGAYAMFVRYRRPHKRHERRGIAFFLLLAALVLLFRSALPRNLSEISPRFVMPLMLPLSVLFGMAIEELRVSLAPPARPPALRALATLAIGAVMLAAFLASWREAPAVELDLKSGHRTYVVDLVETLREQEVRRAYIEYHSGSHQKGWIPLGWELMHASRMEIRFNWATAADRLFNLLDEDAYGWNEYYLFLPDLRNRPGDFKLGEAEFAPGFDAGEYRVIRLPENYLPHGGWLPWSPRGNGAVYPPVQGDSP